MLEVVKATAIAILCHSYLLFYIFQQ